MRRIGDTAIAVVTVVALGSGVWLLGGAGTSAPPQPSAAEGRPDPGGQRLAAPGLDASPPTRIRIPAIRVNAPLMGLSLTGSGSLDVPPAADKNLAGWYEAGITPGERGTAIVAGHVDNTEGPAVFYDLGALKRGAGIEVDREDGTAAVFTVDVVEVYAARNFPDEKVYGAADRPELRVITCGGGYSKATGYQGNVVVFAHLTSSHGSPPSPPSPTGSPSHGPFPTGSPSGTVPPSDPSSADSPSDSPPSDSPPSDNSPSDNPPSDNSPSDSPPSDSPPSDNSASNDPSPSTSPSDTPPPDTSSTSD